MIASDVSGGEWVLDSGASYHMTPNKNWFSSYVDKEGNSIIMGNSVICMSKGIDFVQIRMFDGTVHTLAIFRDIESLLSLWGNWIF